VEALSGTLYVGGYSTAKIYVVDIGQKAVVKTIDLPTGALPDWLALSPDGSKLFCSSNFLDESYYRVYIIDTETNTYVDKVGVCEDPKGIAFTPDGSIAAVVQEWDISLIDVATLTYNNDTFDTISGVRGTGGIAVHPSLNKLYFPGKDFPSGTINQVYISDVGGGATPTASTLGTGSGIITDIAMTSEGGRLFINEVGSTDTLHFVDVNGDGSVGSSSSKTIVHTPDYNYNNKIGLAPDDQKVYVPAYSASKLDYVGVSDTDTLQSIDMSEYASLYTGPRDIAFSSGSTYGFVLIDATNDSIVIMNTSDNSVVDTISLPDCNPRSLVYKQ
jgi:hypothetical protein